MQVLAQNEHSCILVKNGCCIGRLSAVEGRLCCWVQPRWRRRGYGTFLMRRGLQLLKLDTKEELWVRTLPPQASFFEKFGFRKTKGLLYVRRRVPEYNALSVAHAFWCAHIPRAGFVIDATAGNGHDTALLCRLVGSGGRVLAMDIQPCAIMRTRRRLLEQGLYAQLICASHTGLPRYAACSSVDAVVFNLGYLPGAAHDVFTVPNETIAALNSTMKLLKPGGIATVCAYAGGRQGTDERDAVIAWASQLCRRQFAVTTELFAERAGLPPIVVCIKKQVTNS